MHLDLSWNHIRRQGAIEIANGLRVSKADQNSLLFTWPDVKTYMYTFVLANGAGPAMSSRSEPSE